MEKNTEGVEEFKIREADKYLFGQSLNQANALICAYIEKGYEGMGKAETRFQKYQETARKLFAMNKALRKELLGY